MYKIELFNEILDLEEFTLVRYKNGYWGLKDRQGANLGDIESDTFENICQVLDRMEVYHIDYFEEPIMEYYCIDSHTGYNDLVDQCRSKIKNEDEYKDEVTDNFDLVVLEFIANAPKHDICNVPLDNLIPQGLDYEQLDYDYEEVIC